MISRRHFLKMSAAGMLLLGASPIVAKSNSISGECFLIGDGVRGDASLFRLTPYASQPGRVRIWQFNQKEALEIKLPFLPHSFVAHSNDPHRVITFEKWGRHLAEIDLSSMSVVRVTQAEHGRRFFGHGAHSGRFIYATQMDDKRGLGIVSVLDSANHKVVNEFETMGAFPHDCQWLPDTDTLLIVNSRRNNNPKTLGENFSSLVWMDVKTGECLKQLFIETKEFGYAHLAQSAAGFMVLSGSYDVPEGGSLPLLSTIHPDKSVHVLDMLGNTQERLQGEALSLYLDESNDEVTVTLPHSSAIQVWNYRTENLVHQIKTDEPRGLTYSIAHHKPIVSSAQTKNFMMLDNSLNGTSTALGLGGNGSHLYRLNL